MTEGVGFFFCQTSPCLLFSVSVYGLVCPILVFEQCDQCSLFVMSMRGKPFLLLLPSSPSSLKRPNWKELTSRPVGLSFPDPDSLILSLLLNRATADKRRNERKWQTFFSSLFRLQTSTAGGRSQLFLMQSLYYSLLSLQELHSRFFLLLFLAVSIPFLQDPHFLLLG